MSPKVFSALKTYSDYIIQGVKNKHLECFSVKSAEFLFNFFFKFYLSQERQTDKFGYRSDQKSVGPQAFS